MIYAVGSSGSSALDFLVEKLDENGHVIWSRAYDRGAEGEFMGVVALGSRIFVAGYTKGGTAGGADALLAEIDPATGDLVSETLYGGALDDKADGIDTDGKDLYVVGESRSFGNGSNQIMVLRYSVPSQVTNVFATPPGPFIGIGTNVTLAATGQSSDSSPASSAIQPVSAGIAGTTTLTVLVPPGISAQPLNVTASPGGTATFSVSATGGRLSYQWYLNGVSLAGATNSTLVLTNLTPAWGGDYSVVVSNTAGTTNSSVANLSLVSINLFAGITINGKVRGTYKIEYATNLPTTVWTTLTNVVLPSSSYLYIDTTAPASAVRFYRATLQ
jgi:hypothetical protein